MGRCYGYTKRKKGACPVHNEKDVTFETLTLKSNMIC